MPRDDGGGFRFDGGDDTGSFRFDGARVGDEGRAGTGFGDETS